MTKIPGRPDWAGQPFNLFMMQNFPAFLTKLGAVDVQAIRKPLGLSHERVYQMLRTGRITVDNANALCSVANAEKNRAALVAAGREPPSMNDFLPFTGLNLTA